MGQQNFQTSILVDQSPKEVFDSINTVRDWWSESINGNTKKQDDEFIFEVKDVHYSKQKLVEVIPDKKVVWEVTESDMTFIKNRSEWTGTKIIFDITQENNKTKLLFTHEGLIPQAECYDACAPAWTQYIQHSLYQLITSGMGDPNLEGRTIDVPPKKK